MPAIFKKLAISCFFLAFLILVVHIVILSQRTDSETVFWPGDEVVIHAKQGESHAIMVCYDSLATRPISELPALVSEKDESVGVINLDEMLTLYLKENDPIDIIRMPDIANPLSANDIQPSVSTLEPDGPQILRLPKNVAESHNIYPQISCYLSNPLVTENETIRLNTPEHAIVIDGRSEKPPSWLAVGSILGFLLLLWGGVAFSCKSGLFMPKRKLQTHPLYAAAAFLAIIICSYFVSKYVVLLAVSDREILPGFGDLLIMLAGNIVSCLGVSAFIYWFWQTDRHAGTTISEVRSEADKNLNTQQISCENQPDAAAEDNISSQSELRHNSVLLPLFLGIGIAILATLSVLIMPTPGITTTELASQLTSTGYMTFYFVLLAGVYEECLFRGVIQTSLMPGPNARYPKIQNTFAVLITTFLFVLIHTPQSLDHLWALIPIGLTSVISGILRVRSGAIYQSILLHITYNTTLLLPSLIFRLMI